MDDSYQAVSPDRPATLPLASSSIPTLDDAVAAWWAGGPPFHPIADYVGGEVLFRTADGLIFLGRREGEATIVIADNEGVDESLESPWRGAAPVDFAIPSPEVAIVTMMQ